MSLKDLKIINAISIVVAGYLAFTSGNAQYLLLTVPALFALGVTLVLP